MKTEFLDQKNERGEALYQKHHACITAQDQVQIYEELVHVPLIIRIPGRDASAVAQPVSLMDLGPTILDLFGLDTPGHWMGESLVPRILDPDAPPLTRPIGVEAGRRMQALIFPDGYKVMLDLHRRTEEIYDLEADPQERVNLVDQLPDAASRLDAVAGFFAIHEFRADGYETPYRP